MTEGFRAGPIRALYTLALAEGEGVGTAYEYYAKNLVLRPWLAALPPPRRLLIAGLPQRYGLSLDFVALAGEFGAELTIVDERPDRLAFLQSTVAALQSEGALPGGPPTVTAVRSLAELPAAAPYDLALSSEVLQRLPAAERRAYASGLLRAAQAVALFAPNAGNAGHTTHSGLAGMTRALARELGPQNIRANCISPGHFDTTRANTRAPRPKASDHIPLGRYGASGEIAATVRFLCGPGAGFITGQIIHVNGGQWMF